MNRRTNKVLGYINFPVNSSIYKSSGEGGMSVKLVVLPKKNCSACCINYAYEVFSEVLLNDDLNSLCVEDNKATTISQFNKLDKERIKRLLKYFPHYEDRNNSSSTNAFTSTSYLAVITLGSTGWSGWNNTKGKYWYCTSKDLTKDGKILLTDIKKLYKGHEARLLTYLDT